VQRAFVTGLRADATIASLLASAQGITPAVPAVVDQPAEGQLFPYIRVGDHLSIPDDDLGSFGRDVTETLHVWTKTRGNGPGQTISDRVAAMYHRRVAYMTGLLVPSGHYCVRISLDFDQALTDPDPQIRHHVLRFRVVTAQLT
jgi:hypothetical protein